jgi:hypothetical protein
MLRAATKSEKFTCCVILLIKIPARFQFNFFRAALIAINKQAKTAKPKKGAARKSKF